jgi:hypothetical protein
MILALSDDQLFSYNTTQLQPLCGRNMESEKLLNDGYKMDKKV